EPANTLERIEPDGHRTPRHSVDPSIPFVDDADPSIQDLEGCRIEGRSAAVDDAAAHGREGSVALQRGEKLREPAAFDRRVLIEQEEHRGGGKSGRLVIVGRETNAALVRSEERRVGKG